MEEETQLSALATIVCADFFFFNQKSEMVERTSATLFFSDGPHTPPRFRHLHYIYYFVFGAASMRIGCKGEDMFFNLAFTTQDL